MNIDLATHIYRLGIVMAVVNCRQYSTQTYESLMISAANYPCPLDITWYIIDQASTDDTQAWLERLLAYGHSIVNLRQTENIGVSKAWNLGIAHAFGDGAHAALVVNNDIVVAKDYLEKLLPWVEDEGEIFVTGRVVGTTLAELGKTTQVHEWQPYPQFTQFLLTPEVLAQLGEPLFDEEYVLAYYEDNDAVERMAAKGVRSGSVGDVHAIHYCSRSIHEGGVKHQWAFDLNERRFVSKYGYMPSSGVRPTTLPPIPLRPECEGMSQYRVLPEE